MIIILGLSLNKHIASNLNQITQGFSGMLVGGGGGRGEGNPIIIKLLKWLGFLLYCTYLGLKVQCYGVQF